MKDLTKDADSQTKSMGTAGRPMLHRNNSLTTLGGEMYIEKSSDEFRSYDHVGREPMVKHFDNLTIEGEFEGRPVSASPLKGEKAVVKRHPDNLIMEGEFQGKSPSSAPAGDRANIVKHHDNLEVKEGNFEVPEKNYKYVKGDRVQPKKVSDNLKTHGKFEGKAKDLPPKGKRASIVKHYDNLKMEGEHMIEEKNKNVLVAERVVPKRVPDNLIVFGEFEAPPKEDAPVGERTEVKKYPDNIKLEGEFIGKEKSSPIGMGKRPSIKRHKDNLIMDGEF
ncbi:unnamed protein product, partial [Meganyctiphanes norvegica]